MAVGDRKDPYLSNRFIVEIDEIIVGGFSEVSGLQAEIEIEEYQEGGVNNCVHKLPKIAKYPNLTLKRGLIDSDALWEWHRSAVDGSVARKSGRIVLLDLEGNEMWHWTFAGAYPVKWTGPDLRGGDNAVAIETLELAHNGLKKG